MQCRNIALVGAALRVGFGAVGMIVPGSFATLFGIQPVTGNRGGPR